MSTLVRTTYACGHPALEADASGLPLYVSQTMPRVAWPCPDCYRQYVNSLELTSQDFFTMATGCLQVAETANSEGQPRSTTDALQTLGDEYFAVEAEWRQGRQRAMRQAEAVVFRDFLHAARLIELAERRAAQRAAREELAPLVRFASVARGQEVDLFDAEIFERASASWRRARFDSAAVSPRSTLPDPVPDSSDDEEDVFDRTYFDGTRDGHTMLDLLTQLSPDQRTRLIAHTPQDIAQATIAARIERGEEPPWNHLGAPAVSVNIDTVSSHATYQMSSGEVVSVILFNRFVWGVETGAVPVSMVRTGNPE